MIRVHKDMRGNWKAESNFDLADGRSLEITTHKVSSGQLVTTAIVGKNEGAFFSYMMYQDFSKRLSVSKPSRITSKVVDEQQCLAVKQLGDLKVEIAAYYAAKEVETV